MKILGVPVRFVRYPREKHGIEERAHQIDLMQRIIDWFDRYLLGSPARETGSAGPRGLRHRRRMDYALSMRVIVST